MAANQPKGPAGKLRRWRIVGWTAAVVMVAAVIVLGYADAPDGYQTATAVVGLLVVLVARTMARRTGPAPSQDRPATVPDLRPRPEGGDGPARNPDALEVMHADRFRAVSNGYPDRVAEAYGGDLTRAALDTDETVAATVAAWERAQGFEPCDWRAIGRAEGRQP